MRSLDKIYINGRWVASSGTDTIEVFDSLTEEVMATIPSGVAADVVGDCDISPPCRVGLPPSMAIL